MKRLNLWTPEDDVGNKCNAVRDGRANMVRYGRVGKWNAARLEIYGHHVQTLLDNGSEFCSITVVFYNMFLADKNLTKECTGDGIAANEGKLRALFAVWIPVVIEDYVVKFSSEYWNSLRRKWF